MIKLKHHHWIRGKGGKQLLIKLLFKLLIDQKNKGDVNQAASNILQASQIAKIIDSSVRHLKKEGKKYPGDICHPHP